MPALPPPPLGHQLKSRVVRALPHWWDGCLDLLVGGRCAGCQRPGRLLCPRCRVLLETLAIWAHSPTPRPPNFPPTIVTCWYEGCWPDVLAAYKEHQGWSLAPVLAARLWPAMLQLAVAHPAPERLVLVPMPSRAAVVRERGLDTTAQLARCLARRAAGEGWGLRVLRPLRLGRVVADSAGLTMAERARNLAGAMTVGARTTRASRGSDVVLVDDLVTTGATFAEATRALTEAGWSVWGAVAVAATPRRGSVATA